VTRTGPEYWRHGSARSALVGSFGSQATADLDVHRELPHVEVRDDRGMEPELAARDLE
jgi:hypothetical protein